MKAVLVFLIFPILFLSMVHASAGIDSSRTISSMGSVSYLPMISVSVDTRTTVGTNALSLGFMLDGEWRIWRDSPTFRTLAQNASFRLVRFFDWKSSSPRPCKSWNESSETGVFNWTDVDLLVQRITAIGAQPLITLGGYTDGLPRIPTGMSIDLQTGLPYARSFAAYSAEWVNHFKAIGLPVRYYEIFNEPDSYFYDNWVSNSTKLSYFFELFNVTYTQMHQIDSRILIGNDASLYKVFLNYWTQQNGRLDFLSFHGYDSNGMGENETVAFNRTEQRYFVTDGIWYGVNDARQKWLQKAGIWLPSIDSECNFAAVFENGTDPRIQQLAGTVWTALQLRSNVLNDVNYTVYYSFGSSANWEKANKASGGLGFGMINTDNSQPWYPYYVQKLIGNNLQKGDSIVNSTSSSDDVRTLAWMDGRTLNLLIICKTDQPRTLRVNGLSGQLNVTIIDNTYSYLSPLLQNTTLDAGQESVLKGYTVALLQKTM